MKAIVYTSNAGTTKKYAEILGEKTGLPVYSAAEANREVSPGEEIIYLGWLMAGSMKGYKEAAKLYRIAAACAVGMGATGSQMDEVRKKNKIKSSVKLFTLQGGFDINKLSGVYKMMMNTMIKTAGKKLAEKEDRTPDEDDMLDMMMNGGDRVSEENLKDVLEWYEGIILT